MKNRLIAAVLVAVSAAVAAPAFASGYGPAPFYRPSVGAPASQRGVSAQTFAAERNQAAASNSGVGGVIGASSESGGRQPSQAVPDVNVFKGH
ncbi:hypothetical protein H3V53_31225 [Paraburkholderia bengalensis]|uniref:DUF4148 domain-containing protein n=1 Tax=Paraburkholderia bengalensis TaxID=2747562 RepID=A0ABU8J1H2_9BURK